MDFVIGQPWFACYICGVPNKNKLVRYFDYLIDARQKVNCPNSDCNFKGFGMPACTLDSNQNIRFGFGGFLIMISITMDIVSSFYLVIQREEFLIILKYLIK